MSKNISMNSGRRLDKGSYENAIRSRGLVLDIFDEDLKEWREDGLPEEEAIERAFEGVLFEYPDIRRSSLRKLIFDHLYNHTPSAPKTEVTSCSTPTR